MISLHYDIHCLIEYVIYWDINAIKYCFLPKMQIQANFINSKFVVGAVFFGMFAKYCKYWLVHLASCDTQADKMNICS